MIQINLLPARVRKKRESARVFFPVFVASTVLTLAVVGYVWYDQNQQIFRLEKQRTQLDQEIKQYARFEQMLKEMRAQKEEIEKKNGIIKSLAKDRDAVARALAVLSINVPPEQMWFEKLAQAGDKVTLDGVAQSNEDIAAFMRNLDASPLVHAGSVNLVQSRLTTFDSMVRRGGLRNAAAAMTLRAFQVNFRYKPFSEATNQQAKTQ